jgi:flagellar basal body-associated protein FliL
MRALTAVVIVMGVLIVVGTGALFVLIAHRLSSAGSTSGAAAVAAKSTLLDEPGGTRIVGMSASGDRLVVQLQGGGEDRVVVIDLRSGAVAGRVSLAR